MRGRPRAGAASLARTGFAALGNCATWLCVSGRLAACGLLEATAEAPPAAAPRAVMFCRKRRRFVRLSMTGLSVRMLLHDFLVTGTGTPATFTLKEPRLVRVQKYTVFQSSPPNATFAV